MTAAHWTVRAFGGRVSRRIARRSVAVGLVLLALAAGVAAASLIAGSYPIPLRAGLDALFGQGDPMVRMIVTEWRLPRVALAFLLGAALGLSGAIFQSLTRNPLGSPDIIGFGAGAYSGALTVILLGGGGTGTTALGALAGGTLTALLVYGLAYRAGVQGFRLIVVGIGVAAMLSAVNGWMIRKAELPVALSAAIWGAGSLNGLGSEQLGPALLALALLVPPTLWLGRAMRQLELGDDAARASGVAVHRTRLLLIVAGVALCALVTACAGPIAFVALCAPQLAQRLTRAGHMALVPAALMGGLLLLCADWTAQHALGVQLPAGILTVSLGGLYFLWLLLREART